MKIKRLEIHGFKSFVDKVSLDFQQGITSVVGPNGCGKSNVVDAIRWVMGEQSAKNLRGKSMEDIIFGGSEQRKPVGMAEVSLTFSTEDGRVPAKYLNFSEIQVTRRLYRDGESDYMINKTPCRLMDITELFMDTGVGARAYSIIEQGKIGMILHAKPEERRFLIEEAAGVTKFKARKQVALKKIEVTRQNLLRIGDVVAEIRRQLNSLQRQAKKAEKFKEYRDELREIELVFALRRHRSIDEEKKVVEAELAGLANRLSDLAAALGSAELQLEERRIALLEQERSMASAQENLFQIRSEMQSVENRLEFQRKEQMGAERQRERAVTELASLNERVAHSEAELRAIEIRRESCLVELATLEGQLQEKEQLLEESTEGELVVSRNLESLRRELFSLVAEIAQLGNQRSSATKRLEALLERFERNNREEMGLRERLEGARLRIVDQEASLAAAREERESGHVRLGQLKRREEELKEASRELARVYQASRDELSAKASRLKSLRELESQFAGYGQGVKNVCLADRFKGRLNGVLADYLETAEEWEAALESALGERLQCVVGAGVDDVMEAVAFLKETSGGRSGFLCPAGSVSPDSPVIEGAMPLGSLVSVDLNCPVDAGYLLSGIYIVSSLDEAQCLARQNPRLTFVTREGDLATAGGMITGGSSEPVAQGLVHKKREIRVLDAEVERLGQAVASLESERSRLREEQDVNENELKNVRQLMHQAEILAINLEKDLLRSREECQRVTERLEVKALEDEQLRDERDTLERELAEAEQGRAPREQRRTELERELADIQQELEDRRQDIGAVREAVTSLKVQAAALREKRESAISAGKRVETLLSELQSRISSHQADVARGESEQKALLEAVQASEASLRAMASKELQAEAAFVANRESYESASDLSREEESRIRALRSMCDEAKENSAARSLRLAELTLQHEQVTAAISDKFRVNPAAVNHEDHTADFDEDVQVVRLEELRRLIDDMGEVNLTAIDECRELEERFEFLSTQKADLEESLHSLQQAIQRINRTTRKRFLETFQLVNDKFREVFPRLFCGGQGELRLTNEEDLLEAGLDIVVQPPGKKLQNVSLLSGGEKALTAVALIFSIFLIKPSPFCLLDEVDAPLDDANIGRFNDMVREMTAKSQFIIITHNKATMAVADSLYGVTMEEPGVSKLVSVRLN